MGANPRRHGPRAYVHVPRRRPSGAKDMSADSRAAPRARLAFVLHGKVANERVRAKDGGRPSPGAIFLGAVTTWDVLLRPLSSRFEVDVFGHCWSPGPLSPLLNEMWRPVASLFEKDQSSVFDRACRNGSSQAIQARCAAAVDLDLGQGRPLTRPASTRPWRAGQSPAGARGRSSSACSARSGSRQSTRRHTASGTTPFLSAGGTSCGGVGGRPLSWATRHAAKPFGQPCGCPTCARPRAPRR